jgi:hypothetical protein
MKLEPIDARELSFVSIALGPRVTSAALAVARELAETGKASSNAWRIFLQALWEHEEVMNSPLGLAVQMAILGRINGDNENGNGNDASARRQQSSRGAGFPIRR